MSKISVGPGPSEIRARLLKKWERGAFYSPENEFPLRVPLGKISASVISRQFDDVRRWISLFHDGEREKVKPARIEWKEINHRHMGRNRLPGALVFDSPEDLASFLGKSHEYDNFLQSREKLLRTDEKLAGWADGAPFKLLDCYEDLDRLIALWRWIAEHPRSGLFLRQIDLPGIDTKFTEKYKKLLSLWLDLTLPYDSEGGTFEEKYGFRAKPDRVRMRFLDPDLGWFGCSDITLNGSDFSRLFGGESSGSISPVIPQRVFVVENDITALAFPFVRGGIVIFGRGYNFDYLKEADWLGRTDLWYWGDLDTHGFRILAQFRRIFPRTRSFLMDRKTLLEHEVSWGSEGKPANQELPALTDEERALYDDLRFNRLGDKIRLEQEFIRFGVLEKFLKRFE